jgi:hypothetical protein
MVDDPQVLAEEQHVEANDAALHPKPANLVRCAHEQHGVIRGEVDAPEPLANLYRTLRDGG